MNIRQEIEKLNRQIRLRELSDDGYYISRQYKEDCQRMSLLQQIAHNKKECP